MKEKIDGVMMEMFDILSKKSNDYGNSWRELGLKGLFCQMHSKYYRLKNLIWLNTEAKVKEESIRDTLIDLANYCVLSVMMLDEQKGDKDDGNKKTVQRRSKKN